MRVEWAWPYDEIDVIGDTVMAHVMICWILERVRDNVLYVKDVQNPDRWVDPCIFCNNIIMFRENFV